MAALLKSCTEHSCGGLIAAAAQVSGNSTSFARRLAEVLLNELARGTSSPIKASDLNVNGSPLQFLLSVRAGFPAMRLIADPASDATNPSDRSRRSFEALDNLIVFKRASSMRAVVQALVDSIVPLAPHRYPTGTLRLAASLNGPGLAVYTSPPPASETVRWSATRAAAQDLLPHPSAALALIDSLASSCSVFGLGIEGAEPHSSRLKLYWRLGPDWHTQPKSLEWFDPVILDGFFAALVPSGGLPRNAVTFSAGFHMVSGELIDCKIDLCLNAARSSQQDAFAYARQSIPCHGLQNPAQSLTPGFFAQHGIAIACLGLGRSSFGEHRLNVYWYQPVARPLVPHGVSA